MMAVVLAAVFFASSWLGESVRRGILVRNITRVSKRLFGVPDFHYYARATPASSQNQLELPLFSSG